MNEVKILFFLSHPVQYVSPLLEQLSRKTNIHVYYYSDISVNGMIDKGFGREIIWDIPLLRGYHHTFLKNITNTKTLDNRFFSAINPGVVKTIANYKGKVIIVNGWSYFSTWLVFITAFFYRKKVWIRAESPLNQETKKSTINYFIKSILLKNILFRFFIDKFLFIGKQNKEFYKYFGVLSNEKLIYTPYAVNNTQFRNYYLENKQNKESFLIKNNLPTNKKIILFTGKFIEKKRPLDLLAAFSLLNAENYALVMVGDGELRNKMENYVNSHGLKQVYFPGFINQSKIIEYYLVADVFVMCSGLGETWGLSVNEAMNFALPVVVSETCGCSYDLVNHGYNGYIFKEGDVDALATYLEKILSSESERENMSRLSLQIIDQYSIEESVKNIMNEIKKY